MAELKEMPPLQIDEELLKRWGSLWCGENNPETGKTKDSNCFDKQQSINFCKDVFDVAVAKALAKMLGDIPVVNPTSNNALLPPQPDCVEIGNTRIIGGVRPQNFDLVYRPDCVRIAFDSKTLNDISSVRKNWQNMINDLSTEATTVHTRFPYAIVCFLVVIPRQALASTQEKDIIRTLERLGTREDVMNQAHLAEAISFVVWDPQTGKIDDNIPSQDSNLRIEKFSEILYPHYVERYKGLPPH